MSATAHIQLASSSMGVHDDVFGNPKTIRVEKQEGTAATPRLQGVTEYHPGKRVSRRLVYRPDGTLSIREQYEYTGDRLSKVTSFNEAGQQVQAVDVRMIDSETQERVTQGPDGKETERSFIKLSPSGQVIESRMISPLEDSEVVLTIHYDGSDRPTGGAVTFGTIGRPDSRMEITCHSTLSTSVRIFQADGETSVVRINAKMPTPDVVITAVDDRVTSVERIDARDPEGNWTRKTDFQRNSETGIDEPLSTTYRTISYF